MSINNASRLLMGCHTKLIVMHMSLSELPIPIGCRHNEPTRQFSCWLLVLQEMGEHARDG